MTIPALFPYQEEGARMIVEEFGGRALLADQMGAGKSRTALEVLRRLGSKARPAIVVCPAMLKTHWQRETRQWLGKEVTLLHGSRQTATAGLRGKGVYVINYDILRGWLRFLISLNPQLIILEECHYCSNMHSQRSRAVKVLCESVPHVLALSGTPLVNRPWELFPVLNIINPEVWSNAWAFGHKYCNAQRIFGHWKFDGARNLKQLHRQLLQTCMVRRTLAEVMDQLPEKHRIIVPMDIEDRPQYQFAEDDFLRWLMTLDPAAARRAAADIRTRFGYLKRLAAELKLTEVIGWIHSFLEEEEGKLLLGAWHRTSTPIIPRLYQEFGDCAVQVHGGMTMPQRQDAVDRFREDPGTRILIGQIQACGVGLNLPEANTVALVELPFTPGAVEQFVARAYRLTSKNPVTTYLLVAHTTIEEDLCQILQRKSGILDEVLDGGTGDANTLDIYTELTQTMLHHKRRKS